MRCASIIFIHDLIEKIRIRKIKIKGIKYDKLDLYLVIFFHSCPLKILYLLYKLILV